MRLCRGCLRPGAVSRPLQPGCGESVVGRRRGADEFRVPFSRRRRLWTTLVRKPGGGLSTRRKASISCERERHIAVMRGLAKRSVAKPLSIKLFAFQIRTFRALRVLRGEICPASFRCKLAVVAARLSSRFGVSNGVDLCPNSKTRVQNPIDLPPLHPANTVCSAWMCPVPLAFHAIVLHLNRRTGNEAHCKGSVVRQHKQEQGGTMGLLSRLFGCRKDAECASQEAPCASEDAECTGQDPACASPEASSASEKAEGTTQEEESAGQEKEGCCCQ